MSGDLQRLHPRPPVLGSESPPDAFHETGPPPWTKSQLKPSISPPLSPKKGNMAPSPKATSESGSRGFEIEGSADVTPPFSESSLHSSPAYHRWAHSLHNLLDDLEGVKLYKDFLKTDHLESVVDFWFACEGLKKLPTDKGDKIYQLIKMINRKYVRTKKVPVEDKTRLSIQEKISKSQADDSTNLDQSIFDTAQKEVESWMTTTTYPKFFESDIFVQYVQAQQMGPESDFSPKHSGSHSAESSLSGRGLPLADDSGHFSGAQDVGEKSKSGQSTRPPTSLAPGESSTSDSTSGVSESSSSMQPPASRSHHHHLAVPNTSLNVSSRDVSISREMDPSVDESYNLSTSHLQSQSQTALPTVHEDAELECQMPSTTLPSSILTAQSLNLTAKKRHHVKPEAQAGMYLQDRRVPPNPYHAYNSAYNPVSRQDSELQSLSSDAQTTDDNQSSFTESSSHYSYRRVTERKYVKKQAKKMQEQSKHNREAQSSQHGIQAGIHPTAFIPRTSRVVNEPGQPVPADFAAVLTQRLEKLKKERDLEEKLTKKLSEDAGSMVSHNSSSILADICKEKLLPVDDGDGDQSILDDHVSRVWTDKTPLRSPGDPSGRPRSPGFSRRGRSAAPRQTSSGHASSNPHRTLPGRVPSRGPHRDSSSGPMRNVAAHPSGPVYHQDLAYYEIDPRVSAASRMQGMIPHQLESGQTNDRVMEWMLDVERSGGAASHDQRSQSSKGATKTSPRSKARHGISSHSHRAVSQERIQMSNSWSGHPASGSLHYQAQMDAETKRRLGASMAMPPPSQSNNSTLRKAAGQTRAPQGANPADITVAVYTFSHEKGEVMPYRVKIPIKPVTLRLVKDYLPKKGAFRFYFKTEVDGDMCYEEETEDASLVPLWEGKVLVQCRLLD